jgi:hypothetical protein
MLTIALQTHLLDFASDLVGDEPSLADTTTPRLRRANGVLLGWALDSAGVVAARL